MTYLLVVVDSLEFESLAPIVWMPQMEITNHHKLWKTLERIMHILELATTLVHTQLVPNQVPRTPLYSVED